MPRLSSYRSHVGLSALVLGLFAVSVPQQAYAQNLVVNASVAWLQPGAGYQQLFPSARRPYSAVANLLLTF